jgi:hypothetical protein
MNKYNIVYIFGAGASASSQYKINTPLRQEIFNGFPLANNFYKKIEELNTNFHDIINTENGINPIFIHEKLDSIVEILKSKTSSFQSIDEGMKYQFINKLNNGKKSEFDELKKTVSQTFNYIEFFFLMEDNRYKQFLITIIDKNREIPNNINFLSWNYDNQLNIAFGKVLSDSNKRIPDSKLYQINGRSVFINSCYHYICENWINETKLQHNNEYINLFWEEINNTNYNINHNLRFAWEDDNQIDLKKLSYDETKKNIFVYIGYSHPYVNHKTDLELIHHYAPHKIYIQDPNFNNNHAKSLKERFNFSNEIEIINNCERFHIPNEMYF